MSYRLSVFAAAALLSLASLAATARADDLLQVYDAARAYDPVYQSALKAHDAALQKVPQARASLLPNVGLSASTSLNNTSSRTGSLELDASSHNSRAGVAASMPLFRPANNATFEQAKLSVQVAELTRKQAEQDLMTRSAKAYFDVLSAQDALTFTRAQKQAVGEQLASAKRNFEVGTATITDTREAQARFDLTTAQELATENDLEVKRMALQQLTGKVPPSLKPLAVKPELSKTYANSLDSLEKWVERAELGNTGINQSLLAEQVAKFETQKARAGKLPTVDLSADYGISRASRSLTSTGSNRSASGSIGVSVSFPLYTGGAVQSRIIETLTLEEKTVLDTLGTKAAIAQATRQAYLGVRSGLAQVKALEAAELSSQSALDANKLGYQVGVRINIDVLNSQSQLFQTKRDLAKARYDVLTAGLLLESLVGDLSREDLAQVNALLADPPAVAATPAPAAAKPVAPSPLVTPVQVPTDGKPLPTPRVRPGPKVIPMPVSPAAAQPLPNAAPQRPAAKQQMPAQPAQPAASAPQKVSIASPVPAAQLALNRVSARQHPML